jgi:hypothetical protein
MPVDICSSIQLAGDFQVSGTAYRPWWYIDGSYFKSSLGMNKKDCT